MMILSEKSYFRFPPVIIDSKQVVIMDAMRYSLDICELSYKRLLTSLSELTEKNKISIFEFPDIFLNIWSIINNCVIFYKIVSTEFNLKEDEPYFQEFLKAKYLRDSNQHIDERLSQVFKTEDYPIYGSLSWVKIYSNSNDVKMNTIYSGLFTQKHKIAITMTNNVEDELDKTIQKIEFKCVARKGIKPNYFFEDQRISINKIIKDLTWWSNHFDMQLEEQLKEKDLSNRHKSDIVVRLIGKRV